MHNDNFFRFASALAIMIIGLLATWFIIEKINAQDGTATAPIVELPPDATTTNLAPKLNRLVLNSGPYTPTPDVMSSQDAYDRQSIRLILNGNFQTAQLHIVGTTTENGSHFLSLAYGNAGGILNAYRKSATTLNTTLTQQGGGIFTNQSPIDVTLDLLNPIQFASTATDYEKNQQTFKMINLWQSNLLPPTYISLLVAPFNEDGVYGGAQIISTFEYSCSEGYICQVATCPAGEFATVCMRDKFGADVARDWCRRSGHKNCSF